MQARYQATLQPEKLKEGQKAGRRGGGQAVFSAEIFGAIGGGMRADGAPVPRGRAEAEQNGGLAG
jgi:hypothetical protein